MSNDSQKSHRGWYSIDKFERLKSYSLFQANMHTDQWWQRLKILLNLGSQLSARNLGMASAGAFKLNEQALLQAKNSATPQFFLDGHIVNL